MKTKIKTIDKYNSVCLNDFNFSEVSEDVVEAVFHLSSDKILSN